MDTQPPLNEQEKQLLAEFFRAGFISSNLYQIGFLLIIYLSVGWQNDFFVALMTLLFLATCPSWWRDLRFWFSGYQGERYTFSGEIKQVRHKTRVDGSRVYGLYAWGNIRLDKEVTITTVRNGTRHYVIDVLAHQYIGKPITQNTQQLLRTPLGERTKGAITFLLFTLVLTWLIGWSFLSLLLLVLSVISVLLKAAPMFCKLEFSGEFLAFEVQTKSDRPVHYYAGGIRLTEPNATAGSQYQITSIVRTRLQPVTVTKLE